MDRPVDFESVMTRGAQSNLGCVQAAQKSTLLTVEFDFLFGGC